MAADGGAVAPASRPAETRDELDGFLKAHEVWLNYTREDLERERAALRRLGFGN